MERTIRPDIQALRGLAVLLVVLYHAKIPWVRAGYLGVDIFFVISGYLITRLVKNQIEEGRFGFAEFYSRRLRRLLPAAYTTFLATALAAAVLLNGAELRDFGSQLAGAFAFVGNFVLWQQSGYFNITSAFKPLLHVWSLAIEEQYYLLLPAAMVFMPRRLWAPGASIALLSSMGLCAYLAVPYPAATFYLMPTRAWELALGSLGALALERLRWRDTQWGDALYWASAAVLAVIPLAPLGGRHPGLDALLVCAATLCVILASKEALARELPGRILGWFGDISYSLYLVHWPLFAFLHNVWFGDEPRRVRYALVLVSIALAYLQYRFVETPFRRSGLRLNWRTAGWALAAAVLITAIPLAELRRRAGEPDFADIRRTNPGMGRVCNVQGDFAPIAACQTSDHPTVLVWGDSLVMHLVAGLVRHRGGEEIIQATQSACPAILGLAQYDRQGASTYNRAYAERCTDFNDSVLRYLKQPGSANIVVIGGGYGTFMWSERHLLEDRTKPRGAGIEVTLRHLKRTVEAVRGLGKRIVLVSPPPSFGVDVGNCNERRMTGRFAAGPRAGCEIEAPVQLVWNGPMLELFKRIQREADVDVISFDGFLCDSRNCRTMLENKLLYRDSSHLSYDGSEIIARRTGLMEQILAKAR